MVRDYDEAQIPSVYNFPEVPPAREGEGFEQRIFRGLDLMVGFNIIEPDKPDAEPHSHPWEQVNMLLEGQLDFVVGDEVVRLEPYDILEIPPGVEHTARTVPGQAAKLLAFWPLRDDYLEGTAYQTEFQGE